MSLTSPVRCLTGALVLAAALPAFAATPLEREFRYAADRFQVNRSGPHTLVEVQGAAPEFTAGRPDLPWLNEVIEVPEGQRVVRVELIGLETAPLAESAQIPSAVIPTPGIGPKDRSLPDPEHFGRAGFQPAAPARLGYQGWQRGRNLAYVEVCPVRWDAASGRLERVVAMRVRLHLAAGFDEKIPRLRVVPEWEDDAASSGAWRSLAARAAAMEAAAPPRRAEPFAATQVPSVLGSPVAYVIVTDDAMAPEFQRLADWKTHAGVPAAVRTMSFIRQQYHGVDDAERVRLFLRDAYSRWSTKWVLLGGDTEIIPVRYANTKYFGGENIASDLYYSCLDRNWDADGDGIFGEGYRGSADRGDSCDILPEVWVGRAPVTTVAQARQFVDRNLLYQKQPAGGYENGILFFAEVLFPQPYNPGDYITLDGAELAEEVLPYVRQNPAMRYTRLYQTWDSTAWEPGAHPLSKQAVLDSLDVGYNMSVHIGHGYRNVMSVADGDLDNGDALGLTNGNRFTNLYSTNCTSNAIDFPCIGEAFLLSPSGGAVSNVGSSRFDFPNSGRYYQREYFRLMFDDSVTAVGEVQGRQKLPFVGSSNGDGVHRWTQMTMLLIGDPELRMYTGLPRTLTVSHPASVPLSDSTIQVNVTVGGAPLEGARVTAFKSGDEYRIGTTNAAGNLSLPFRADQTGSVILTVTALNARPYQDTLAVTPAAPPVLADLAPILDDDASGGTVGNGNGLANAGETIDLRIPVKNNGGSLAPVVGGTLTTTDPMVTITTPFVSYGSISAGATSNPAGGFRIVLPYTMPDQREIPFLLTLLDGNGRQFVENVPVTVLAPELFHLAHLVGDGGGNGNGRPEAGETVTYTVRLRNLGTGGAASVTGRLRNLSNTTVTDSIASWGSMAAGEEKNADAFEFTVNGTPARLELRVSSEYGLLWTQAIDVDYPAPPTNLNPAGFTSAIDLRWTKSPAADLYGYNVYRATSLSGPYTKVNVVPSGRIAYYQDGGLTPLSTYFYQVTAVDSSGNESAPSASVSASTTPGYHASFPIPMGGNSWASVAIDHVYSGYPLDIAAGAGVIHVWHPDGTAPVDADGQGSTFGDFTTLGSRYDAGPSIADLDGNGAKEVIGVAWNPDIPNQVQPRLYVFDHTGAVRPGFPATTFDPVWSSVAIGDLNNDGSKELVFGSNGNKIYAYRATGAEWRDGDSNPATAGVFKVLAASFNYATPALADIDNNGVLDIVFAAFDKNLYVWRPDGTNVPGFPRNVGDFMTAAPAVGHLDGFGDTEYDIVVVTGDYHNAAPSDSIHVFRANGQKRAGWPVSTFGSSTGRTPSPALGDIDGDGRPDVVVAGTNGVLRVLDRNGVPIAGIDGVRYSSLTVSATESSPVIADINGDGRNDIVIGDEDQRLTAISGMTGQLLPGFPIVVGAEIKGTPALCDCDGDGLTEIVLTANDGQTYMWDYDYPFSPTTAPPWPQFHHDAARTGRLDAPIFVDAPGDAARMPQRLELAPALPNPAGRGTRIAWAVPADRAGQSLELAVYDLGGRQVQVLESGPARAGRHSVAWNLRHRDGGRVENGVYFVRLRLGAESASQKLIVLQ